VKIRKAIQNYVLVGLLVIGSLVEAVSGFVLWFALPHSGGRWASLQFWSITRTEWVDIHDWAAVALIVVVLVHLLIHWKWVVTVTRQIIRATRQPESESVGDEIRVKIN
jgi:cytochrome b subunit of formate dehydrogenase